MSTVIERLNITAILAADPIPDEPMTLPSCTRQRWLSHLGLRRSQEENIGEIIEVLGEIIRRISYTETLKTKICLYVDWSTVLKQ